MPQRTTAEPGFLEFAWVWNRRHNHDTPAVHRRIARWLESRQSAGDRRLLLMAFRGCGKSTILRMIFGNYRISAFQQKGSPAVVIRYIPSVIPPIDSLDLPDTLKGIIMRKRGLVLVVGATGSGKTTSIAAMLDHRNSEKSGHILTLEDPVEFVFKSKKSIVNQREVGSDTKLFTTALKNALRQAPDCILIGEIRDRETMTAAVSYALSGHLVVSTLHANNSYHALGRILSFYTPESRPALLNDLSSALKAVVSQRLVRATAGGRQPAVEVLLNTKLISDLIAQGDFAAVKEAMEQSLAEGSQTFEQELARMINEGRITRDEGLAYADSPTNLMWRLQNDTTTQSKLLQKALTMNNCLERHSFSPCTIFIIFSLFLYISPPHLPLFRPQWLRMARWLVTSSRLRRLISSSWIFSCPSWMAWQWCNACARPAARSQHWPARREWLDISPSPTVCARRRARRLHGCRRRA